MAEIDAELAVLYAPLDEGAKLTLGAAAKTPGSLLVVDKDSDSEKMCQMLAGRGLAETVDISEQFPKGRVSGWRLYEAGGRTVMPLFGDG